MQSVTFIEYVDKQPKLGRKYATVGSKLPVNLMMINIQEVTTEIRVYNFVVHVSRAGILLKGIPECYEEFLLP
jgi:hypothetical protein